MEDWTQISFSIIMPHQAMLIGYEMVEPNEEQHWFTFSLHCFFITLRYEWGSEDNPYQ